MIGIVIMLILSWTAIVLGVFLFVLMWKNENRLVNKIICLEKTYEVVDGSN